VSPRRLWGWEPETTTFYEYDDDGKLRSSTTVREPEFDESDLEFFRALDELEQDTGSYGELLSEALSDDSDPNSREAKHRYTVDVPYMNWAAFAVGQAQEAYYSKNEVPDAERKAHVWVARRVEK
jgi:hypothetical protein